MKTKKELKEAYKQSKPTMGVFQIRNKVSGKVFIDSAVDIAGKQNRHQAELKFGNHRIQELQRDWKTLGAENFVFEVLEKLEPQEGVTNYIDEVKELKEMVTAELKLSPAQIYTR